MNPKKHFGYSCVPKWIPEKSSKVLPISFWKRSSVFLLRIPSEGPLPFVVAIKLEPPKTEPITALGFRV